MRKEFRIVCLAGLMALGISKGQALSPALALFDEIVAHLQTDYVNPHNMNLQNITPPYRQELERNCTGKPDCGYAIAEPVIRRLLESFKDPHLEMRSDSSQPSTVVGGLANSSRYGFRLATQGTTLTVTHVQPASSSAESGIRVGDQITTINGETVRDGQSASQKLAQLETQGRWIELILERANTAPIKLEVTPRLATSWPPTMRMLEDGTAVIVIPDFGDLGTTDQAVHDFISAGIKRGAKRFVLDLRLNEGGASYAAVSIAGIFLEHTGRIYQDKQGVRETLTYDAGKLAYTISSEPKNVRRGEVVRPARWKGPLAVLVSSTTVSAGENLADLLQAKQRALIVGEPTAGALGTSTGLVALRNSRSLLYAAKRYSGLDGRPCPTKITPDINVTFDLQALHNGHDNVLDVARTKLTVSK